MKNSRGSLLPVAVCLLTLWLVGSVQGWFDEPVVPSGVGTPSVTVTFDGTGMELPGLVVAEEVTKVEEYDRGRHFGPAWRDVDRNGCDTRNDILRRDLTNVEFRPGTNSCVVVTGVLHDPYTGQVIDFTKDQALKVQIDHVIPLSYAWGRGAETWSARQRLEFANDPVNLLAVDGPANASKGDKGPSEWLPPDQAHWCAYVLSFAGVAADYGLSVSQEDWDVMTSVAATC